MVRGIAMLMLCIVLTLGMPRVCSEPMPAPQCYEALADWVNRALPWVHEYVKTGLPARTLAGCVPA